MRDVTADDRRIDTAGSDCGNRWRDDARPPPRCSPTFPRSPRTDEVVLAEIQRLRADLIQTVRVSAQVSSSPVTGTPFCCEGALTRWSRTRPDTSPTRTSTGRPMDPPDLSSPGRPKRTAHRKTGEPCQRYPIHGGTVCATHGGSAPQVKKAARRRLAELVDPSITTLGHLISARTSHRKGAPLRYPAQALSAAKDVLDRTGHQAVVELDIFMHSALLDTDQASELSTEEINVLLPALRKWAASAAAKVPDEG